MQVNMEAYYHGSQGLKEGIRLTIFCEHSRSSSELQSDSRFSFNDLIVVRFTVESQGAPGLLCSAVALCCQLLDVSKCCSTHDPQRRKPKRFVVGIWNKTRRHFTE